MKSYNRYTLFLIVYTLVIILWGAFVRISNSGDGCGAHWPLCLGQYFPSSPTIATLIEKGHRLSTAIYGLCSIVLVAWAWKLNSTCREILRYSIAVLFFTLVEALIGAQIVLQGWVAQDMSSARAIMVALHLINTFLLMTSLWLTYENSTGNPKRIKLKTILQSSYLYPLLVFLGIIAIGGFAALSSTLFPTTSLAEGFAKDISPASPWFLKIRFLHPLFASMFSIYILKKLSGLKKQLTLRERGLRNSLLLGLTLGFATFLSLGPLPLKLLHLASAHLIWLALLAASTSEPELEQCTPKP